MSLEFADFSHHFENSGLSEDAQRKQFSIYADFLECLARWYFYSDDAAQQILGAVFGNDSNALEDHVELKDKLKSQFNQSPDTSEAESEKG